MCFPLLTQKKAAVCAFLAPISWRPFDTIVMKASLLCLLSGQCDVQVTVFGSPVPEKAPSRLVRFALTSPAG